MFSMVVLNYGKIESIPERFANIKLFINKYNWNGINYPWKIDYQKKNYKKYFISFFYALRINLKFELCKLYEICKLYEYFIDHLKSLAFTLNHSRNH